MLRFPYFQFLIGDAVRRFTVRATVGTSEVDHLKNALGSSESSLLHHIAEVSADYVAHESHIMVPLVPINFLTVCIQ